MTSFRVFGRLESSKKEHQPQLNTSKTHQPTESETQTMSNTNTNTKPNAVDAKTRRAARVARVLMVEDVASLKVLLQDARDNGVDAETADEMRGILEAILDVTTIDNSNTDSNTDSKSE